MMLNISSLDESILGRNTNNPLQQAFVKKHSPHAHAMGRPKIPDNIQASFTQTLTNNFPQTKKRCLYIHIPFCRVRCTFCNFFQHAASRNLVNDYFAALMTELKQKAQTPWTQSGIFHAVYIGGGTPTDLSAKQIEQLGLAIHQLYPLAPDCEITLEGRINGFSDDMYQSAINGGFNRFSFGIQSFNTQVRRSAKRLNDRDEVIERLANLSQQDQAPIVIDLLYGLPYQDLEVFEQDLTDYLSTGAHGIDLYQLIVGGSAPMINLVEKGKIPASANTEDKALMFKLGVEFMDKHHLRRLSVNHWTRDNRERSLYNSVAKTSAEVLPIGCGAGGNIGDFQLMHHRKLDDYMQSINNNQPPIAMMMNKAPDSALFDTIKAGCDAGVLSRSTLTSFKNGQVFNYLTPLFKHWQKKGLVTLEQDYLLLTLAGAFWNVTLAQNMIQVLQMQKSMHTAA